MKEISQKMLVEMDVCPNCWGRQSYDHQYKSYVQDKTQGELAKDSTQRKAFIQKFVERHVTGIRLKNKICPVCEQKY